MALITDAAVTWSSPVTLNVDEVWQAQGGKVFVTTTANPVADDGIQLRDEEAIQFSAGLQVRYRKGDKQPVVIAREAV